MKLYDHRQSGNAYKVRLLLAQLAQPYERVELDIERGETRTPDFLRINPNGRIPVLELDDGRHLCESGAILFFLAHATPFLPGEPWDVARALQWMFFEQYSHEPYVAVVRHWIQTGATVGREAEIEERRARGYDALAVMEGALRDRPFLVADRYTIADIALYAYTHVAHQGGFDLSPYPALRAWLERVREQAGHVTIDD